MRAVVLVFLVGCWSNAPAAKPVAPPPAADPEPVSAPHPAHEQTTMQRLAATFTAFKDEMCACKDTACAQRVSDEMTKWGQQAAKDQQEPPKMSEEDTKAFTVLGEEMGKCMQQAMSAPTTTP